METKTINKVKEWIERAEMGFFEIYPNGQISSMPISIGIGGGDGRCDL